MAYDGAGIFTRVHNWTADKVALIKIQSVRMDAEFDNFAQGMNEVILRNGVTPFTGNLKLGGNKITGLGSGVVASPAIQGETDATTGIWFPAAGVLAFSAAGVERARASAVGFSITGKFGVNTAAPRTQLDMGGGLMSIRGVFEDIAVAATALTGVVNIDYKTSATYMFTANAAGNWSFNVRGDGATTLDSIMGVGQMLTFAVEVPQGATAYYCTAITIDGAAAAGTKWQGGPLTAGNVSGNDVYLIRVIKTAAATFYVRASMSQEI